MPRFGDPAPWRRLAPGTNPVAGPTASFAEQLGHYNPYRVGQDTSSQPFVLREEEQGRGALGYYAAQPGLANPFADWLTSPGTHSELWDDYLGLASERPGSYFFQDYLAEFDPRLRWMNKTADQRGETPQSAYALPARLNVKQ